MSMTINHATTMQQLQHDWAGEKLSHIASILDYLYGIDVTPTMSKADDDYSLVLKDEELDADMWVSYKSADIIKSNVDEEALQIWMTFVSALPFEYEEATEDDEPIEIDATASTKEGHGTVENMPTTPRIDMAEEPLRRGLASEKLAHITSILEYRYGIKATPVIIDKHDEYQVCMDDVNEFADVGYCYDIDDMLECNAEYQASYLRKLFVWHHAS
ncbi:hypothetical protein [Alicyclobacillus mengziensis]|uniref:Uncharacterized protein n=1 Tax=Alicyclobacillus mengziensis TaxID=2931921 RepID=A0A9X7Z8J7_9BACL|nr:hypothetical protein [Alicyclobacillus mengziensis]QSO48408.1 hypothetical protein JZ786_05315 [Alicyclobacillus mengziensis]